MVAVVQAAEMLEFVETPGQIVRLSPLGRTFVEAEAD
jgi:hypothetical protein